MNIRKNLLQILAPAGYAWGLAAAISGSAVLFMSGTADHALAQLPFMKVHPIYSGGEIAHRVEADGAEWRIHRAVFDGLLSERHHGFVQVDAVFDPADAKTRTAAIDYDADGRTDFEISLPATDGTPQVKPLAPAVTGLERYARTRTGWIIRVGLNQ